MPTIRSGCLYAFFLDAESKLTFSFEVMFPADVFLSGHVNGGLILLRSLLVAEANVAAHGLNSDYCALEWACEGRAALPPMGFAGCLRQMMTALKLVALPWLIDADLMETS
ncbi:hypothetical protein Nepgr_013448 [Nepenthes gracilis]|uniref:Uncharacterized protein n=1 Tax=Nepenthes gracilis TaxID=150966 RepID=A0AAD3XNN8_NEPGR|nr:hypothetical protein Nepgr_013448 [Nepenthes gracilis]